MDKRLISILMAGLIMGFLGAKSIESFKSSRKLKPHDEMVIDSFRIGCEFGVLKSCSPGSEDVCKKYCSEVISNNRSLIEILKNKK